MAQGQSYPINFLRQDNFYTDPITNNLSTNNPAYPYAGTFAALLAALGYNVRTKAATDYYVDPVGGNDAAPGTIGAPWKTYLHAMAVITGLLDFAGQAVTLHLVNNNSTEQVLLAQPWLGGTLTLDLGTHAINAVSQDCILCTANLPAVFTVQNGSLSNSGTGFFNGIAHTGVGNIAIGTGMSFGNALLFQMVVNNPGAKLTMRTSYTITGDAIGHMATFLSGAIVQDNGPGTVSGPMINITGARTFSNAFVQADGASNIIIRPFNNSGTNVPPYRVTGSGTPGAFPTVTGKKFQLTSNANINTLGGQASPTTNWFPGSLAGTNDGTGVML